MGGLQCHRKGYNTDHKKKDDVTGNALNATGNETKSKQSRIVYTINFSLLPGLFSHYHSISSTPITTQSNFQSSLPGS
jgi:hypothetical protein